MRIIYCDSIFDNNFFTTDIAKKKNGEWIIMELGNGQVAGLPNNTNKNEFYNKLKENVVHKKPYRYKLKWQ